MTAILDKLKCWCDRPKCLETVKRLATSYIKLEDDSMQTFPIGNQAFLFRDTCKCIYICKKNGASCQTYYFINTLY